MRSFLFAATLGAAVARLGSQTAVSEPVLEGGGCSGTDYDYLQLVTQWDISQCMVR